MEEYSNRVCELQVLVIHSLILLPINIYRPPDASLEKFRDTVAEVDKVVEDSEDENANIFITGDFNFRPEVVKYKRADDAIIPITKQGQSQAKQAFNELQKLTDKYLILQITDTPTRKDNISDLCFTNDLHGITTVESITIRQCILDHNMVRIRTTYSIQKEEIQTYGYDLPENGKYDFAHANHKDLAEALGQAVKK